MISVLQLSKKLVRLAEEGSPEGGRLGRNSEGMAMDRQSKENLKHFFQEIKILKSVYHDPELTYLIHNGPKGVALISARLVLQPLTHERSDRVIEAGNFYGFSGRLATLGLTPQRAIQKLLSGHLPAPDRTWLLTPNEHGSGPHLFRNNQPSENSLDKQQRILELMGTALSAHYWRNQDDDWSLRAATPPYSDINDLMVDLGFPVNSHLQLHVLAFPPLMIDATSRVRGEIADLKLLRSAQLPVSKTAMGVVVRSADAVTRRARISGEEFTWSQSEHSPDVLIGKVELAVDRASVVHCLAVYDQQCLHHYFVGDPDASQNALRTIYELFDPSFDRTREMLDQSSSRGNSDGQEQAVTALLWVLGFAPLHVGSKSEAPDVVAISRDGHFVVVECTLSDLQTKKNKPQKLVDRTKDIREALKRSNAIGSICIPVMVTSRKAEDIQGDIEDCQRRGIVVYTKDDIEPLISGTISAPRSDLRFAEARQRLEQAISRAEGEERQKREMARDVEEMKKSFEEISRIKDEY